MKILEDVPKIPLVKDIWASRRKSNIVKWLMGQSGIPLEIVSKSIGKSNHYTNNKLMRDSFSFDNLIAIAYVCGKNGIELPSDNTMIIIAILLVAENIFWKRTK